MLFVFLFSFIFRGNIASNILILKVIFCFKLGVNNMSIINLIFCFKVCIISVLNKYMKFTLFVVVRY